MFDNVHFERLRQLFADKFEADDLGLLYRKSPKSAPIRVTAAERDRFITTFNRRLRYMTWAILPATLVLIGLLVVLVPDVHSIEADVGIWAGLGVMVTAFLTGLFWAQNEPARELERRPIAAAARTPDEVRALMFSQMQYRQLGLAALCAPLLVWMASAKFDVLHGWGVLWLAFAASIVLGASVQAIRKWLYEGEQSRRD